MGKIKLMCDKCGKEFSTKSNLYRHERAQHAAIIVKIQCGICGNKMQNKSNFLTHVSRAHKESADAAQKFKMVHVNVAEVSVFGASITECISFGPAKFRIQVIVGTVSIVSGKSRRTTRRFAKPADRCEQAGRFGPADRAKQ